MKECLRCKELEKALSTLIDLYIANINTDSEFITCITPKNSSSMTFFERKQNEIWRAFDTARMLLGGKYIP